MEMWNYQKAFLIDFKENTDEAEEGKFDIISVY